MDGSALRSKAVDAVKKKSLKVRFTVNLPRKEIRRKDIES
jgi:hypothetical protein